MTQASLFPQFEGISPASSFKSLEEQAEAAECWETDPWAARAILEVEILTRDVLDPCCGTGILSEAARAAGYDVLACDLYDWGYAGADNVGVDFLQWKTRLEGGTVLMNPPFSLACQFVDHARELGARKIVCFQRQPWRESDTRRAWWEANPPARVWVCGNRATCWLFTVPPEERGSGTPKAHAWYVWERGHRGAELMGAIWKDGNA
ncbi:MAG: hypothetical protein IH626_01705 [Rhodospirillales bacterium]|nr:hypothetical protein [Rhodospirillales bacterium]